jgi:DNA-binding NtrC family response regulator
MPARSNKSAPYWVALEMREREIIEQALTATEGNASRAASALGIDRTYLTKRMKQLGVDRKAFVVKEATT